MKEVEVDEEKFEDSIEVTPESIEEDFGLDEDSDKALKDTSDGEFDEDEIDKAFE